MATPVGRRSRPKTQSMIRDLPERTLFDCANQIESLKCLQCANFETHDLAHLRHHLKAGHTPLDLKERRYDCENCDFRTHSRYLFLRHELNPCKKGDGSKSERTGSDKELHFDQFHESGNDFGCHRCSYRTPIRSVLDQHLKVMHRSAGSRSHKCDHCEYVTTRTSALKCHILVKHTEEDKIEWFECAQCPYRTKYKFVLKRHTGTRHDSRVSLLCDQCPFQTKFIESLRNHIVAKHTRLDQIRWFPCPQCPYKSKTRPSLWNHIDYRHGDRKSLRCAHCTFETHSKRNLRGHILLRHTELEKIQWFECDQCPYKSKAKSYLRNHLKNKHGTKEYLKCELCAFEARFRAAMKYHILSAHTDADKIPWFRCAQCSYKSKTNGNLKKHVRNMHCDREVLKCDRCPFRTKHEPALRKHVLARHDDLR